MVSKLLNPKIIIYVLIVVIFVLVAYMIMRQPSSSEGVASTNTDKYEQKIKDQEQQINQWKKKAEDLKENKKLLLNQIDSLSHLKNKIKIKYREVYINISTANNNELDSLIRANW